MFVFVAALSVLAVASAAPTPAPYGLTELISFADKCDIDVQRIPDNPAVPNFVDWLIFIEQFN